MTAPANPSAAGLKMSKGAVRVLTGACVALGLVILAPIALSSQDLYAWAASPRGLGLRHLWPYLVPVSLDLAAAACIGMTVVSVWRRERPGIFGKLVWVFVAVSAYAQYTHGIAERDAGRAQDAWWFMPAIASLGAGLLEVTLHKIRQWLRQDADEVLTGAAGFGVRWLVALPSTLSAWAVSRREGISSAPLALRFVADRRNLRELDPVEAVRYAVGACGKTYGASDGHTVRIWLAQRGVSVTSDALASGGASGVSVASAQTSDADGSGRKARRQRRVRPDASDGVADVRADASADVSTDGQTPVSDAGTDGGPDVRRSARRASGPASTSRNGASRRQGQTASVTALDDAAAQYRQVREVYLDAVRRDGSMTGRALGDAFGKTDGWGRTQRLRIERELARQTSDAPEERQTSDASEGAS